MKDYQNFLTKNKIKKIIPDKEKAEQKYWLGFFKKEYRGKFIFWDLKWLFSLWSNEAVSITPNNNLVTNIGFGQDATHTKEDFGLSIATKPINQIIHPREIIVSLDADRYLYKKVYRTTFWRKLKYKFEQLFG